VNIFRRIKSSFLYFTGNIKVFPWPMFIVYDPVVNRLTGEQIRSVLNTVKEGDILARGYTDYMDSLIIPGKYSHTGIYIGGGRVIHAIAEGVTEVDILDFLQCDKACIIRLKDDLSPAGQLRINKAIGRAKGHIGKKYDYFFTEGDDAFYCHEMTADCYHELGITKMIAKAFWGLIRKKTPVYLAQSFLDNENLRVVLEV